MRSLSVLLCFMTLFAFFIASGNIKLDFIETPTSANLEEDRIFDAVNNSNLTFFSIGELFIDLGLRDTCATEERDVRKAKRNWKIESGPKRARTCLKNVENCMKEGPSTSRMETCTHCEVTVPASRFQGHVRSLVHKEKASLRVGEGMEVIQTAFKQRVVSVRIHSQRYHLDFDAFFAEVKKNVEGVVAAEILRLKAVKVNLEVFALYVHPVQEVHDIKSFNTPYQVLNDGIGMDVVYEHLTEILKNKAAEFQEKDSDLKYDATLAHLTNFVFNSFPPLDLSPVDGVSKGCKVQSRQYLQALKRFEFWALSMYDSTAKMTSGILSGNINQFGDFDLCLNAISKERNVQGQYCLASIQVEEPVTPYLQAIHSLVYSHSPFKSNLRDPGHRVPKYSSINWGLCVPASCSADDVVLGLRKTINEVFNSTEIKIDLDVDSSMCYSKSLEPLPFSTKCVGFLFLTIIAVIAASTVYDYYTPRNANEWLISFSLRKNMRSLFSTDRPSNDVEAMHGVRLLNAFCLLLAHKSLVLFFVPYVNRTEMSEIIGKRWTVLGRAASLYTDPFIMMSGALTAYNFLNKLKKTNKIDIINEYVSRVMRIVPTLGALILFCTFILPFLNNGPLWNQVVTQHSHICKKYWWRNLLFIHNYFGFKNMCLTHTHHTGIDAQLFFLSPFLVLLLWKWPKRGCLVLLSIAIVSTVMRSMVTYSRGLSNYIHYGTSIEQLFNTADHMYTLPMHRLTIYVTGIFLGYILRMHKGIKLNEVQLWIGHVSAVVCAFISFMGPSLMGDIDYIYDPSDAAWYAAIVPIFWCFPFAWVIFTHHLGYKTKLGNFFSWKGFLITTRISYTIYLTQFPVFFYNVGITRHIDYYGFFTKNINFKEIAWIVFLSMVLTLTIEMPFNNIRNSIFKKRRKQSSEETKKGK